MYKKFGSSLVSTSNSNSLLPVIIPLCLHFDGYEKTQSTIHEEELSSEYHLIFGRDTKMS